MVTTSWASLPILFNILTATITSGSAVPTVNPTSTTFSWSWSSTASRSTITAAPSLPYGGQVIPINTCSYWNETESQYLWNKPWCSIKAGTVQLTYWPTGDNYTYPSTFYDASLDYTFTSPSVYMVIDTIYGYNTCGPLGPTSSNAIFAFDLTDVYTLVPYAHTTETHRPYTRQLQLSDLGRSCASVTRQAAVATTTWGSKSNETRCNPNLIIPPAIKRYGSPYWDHCGNVGNKFGLFDPPYAIQPVGGLFGNDPTTTSVADPVPTTSVADPVPTTTANVEPSTAPIVTEISPNNGGSAETSSPGPDSSAIAVPTTQDTALPTDVPNLIVSTPIQSPVASPTISDILAPPATVVNDGQTLTSTYLPLPVGGATQGSQSIPSVETQVASLGPSGLEIVSVVNGQTYTSTVPLLSGTAQPVLSVVTYQGHTLTAGGAAVTVTTAISTVSPGTAAVSVSIGTQTDTTATSAVPLGTAAVSGSVGTQTTLGSTAVSFSTAVSSNTTSTAPVPVVTAAAVRTIGETSSVFFGLAVVLLMI